VNFLTVGHGRIDRQGGDRATFMIDRSIDTVVQSRSTCQGAELRSRDYPYFPPAI